MKNESKWTWARIHKEQANMTDSQLNSAIESLMPADIERITDKIDEGLDLTEAEELRLEQWENSPESGPAGSLMSGQAFKSTG